MGYHTIIRSTRIVLEYGEKEPAHHIAMREEFGDELAQDVITGKISLRRARTIVGQRASDLTGHQG